MAKQNLPFVVAPPPWSCKCTAYVLPFFYSASSGLPADIAYAPLEAASSAFSSSSEAGAYKGGLCMLQIIRYTETPVGPYDEMALLPGDFSTPKAKGSDMRITRIYVSQKDTCYNGRKNWNIPKHLARFEFKSLSKSRSTSSSGHAQPPIVISVFPPSTSDSTEIKPFFTTTLEPVAYLPRSYSFPFNSTWATYFGFSGHMVQPPLPSGPTLEECGTEKWIKAKPELRSKKTRMVWWDMRQPKTETGGERSEGTGSTESDTLLAADQASKRQQVVSDNWWPGLGKWRIGLWLEDAVLELGEGETFTL